MPARHAAPGIHGPVMGNLGGKSPSEAPTVRANFSVALQMCVHSWEHPESQMAISVLHTALPASQPALPIMNFLCGISLRPQKLVSALQFGWGGYFGGEGESWKGLFPVVGS